MMPRIDHDTFRPELRLRSFKKKKEEEVKILLINSLVN